MRRCRSPRSRRRGWIPLLAAAAIAAAATVTPAAAQLSGDLYQTTVIVTGTDTRSRPVGFAEALRKVLVNLSGEPRLHDDPRVSALAARAGAAVASFSYVDRMAGRPVHDEQGTRDRPYNFTVKFVRARVDEMLESLGQHAWTGTRPVVVPVLAVTIGPTSYLLSGETPHGTEQRPSFRDMARDFDLTVRFPAERELAAWGVRTAGFPTPPSAAAPNDAVVAGTLRFDESLPGWVGSWRWRWHGTVYTWGIKGVSFDEAFRDICRGVLRVAAGHGAPD